MDKIAKTCGHYDSYIQNAVFDKHLRLSVPNTNVLNNPLNECYNEDANELVTHISADLVYIDPPCNARQYCDTYHLLENVAKWQKPDVFGVAKKMDRIVHENHKFRCIENRPRNKKFCPVSCICDDFLADMWICCQSDI